MSRRGRPTGSARALPVLGAVAFGLAAISLGGCAMTHDLWPHRAAIPAEDRQVAVFDGHELWVDYACDNGARFRVRYLGAWAEVIGTEGKMVTLARPRDQVSGSYSNGGYVLSEARLDPQWTTPTNAETHCSGTLA